MLLYNSTFVSHKIHSVLTQNPVQSPTRTNNTVLHRSGIQWLLQHLLFNLQQTDPSLG